MKAYFIKVDKKKREKNRPINPLRLFVPFLQNIEIIQQDLSKVRCSPVSYFSNLASYLIAHIHTYIHACIYIFPIIYSRHTHTSDFHASSFPRNWREIVEHQAFPRNQNVPQFEVDASSCVTQRGLEPSVLFSFPFSFLFFFLYSPFLFVLQREES